jgi:hypothetical protein
VISAKDIFSSVSNSLLSVGLLASIFVQAGSVPAEPMAVHYPEGSLHGFLVLRTNDAKILADGDLIQTVHGDRVKSELIFHFKDGSVDDETAVFSQHGTFRLLSDHHVQKGPIFPSPEDVFIDASKGQVTVRYRDKDHEKVETTHLDLPPDLANGIVLVVLKNISPDTKEAKLSYIGTSPKPRLVHLSIVPEAEGSFSIAGARRTATRFRVKAEIGGIAGLIAPLVGKQPADTRVWISSGPVPAFVKSEGPHYLGGPLWTIELASTVWGSTTHSNP